MYLEFCEELWGRWLADSLVYSDFVKAEFQLDYLPEPYLQFGDCKNPLYVFTTNPGAGLPVQSRASVMAGNECLRSTYSYQEISRVLGDYYSKNLKGTPKTRILGMMDFAKRAGFDGVFQVEACPFHSAQLPKKDALLDNYQVDPFLSKYAESLQVFLRNKPVLIISAVGTKGVINTHSVSNRRWLNWQSNVINLNIDECDILPVNTKNNRITSAFVYSQKSKITSGFILMMGGNHMPKSEHLGHISELFRVQNKVSS